MSRAPNPIAATIALSVLAVIVYAGTQLLVNRDPAAPAADAGPGAAALTVPDFSMPDLAGNPVSLQAFPGKPLIINFWATWCAPCLREIPMLMDYQTQHPDVQIIGIAVDSPDAVQAFAADMAFNYPILIGPAAGFEAAAALGAEYVALPLTVFSAADQRLYGTHMGELHAEHLERFTAANTGIAAGSLEFAAAQALIAETH